LFVTATFPQSLAIAGAWGYIGEKFLHAAKALGLRTYVYDPNCPPPGIDWQHAARLDDESDFYRLPVDLYHLALHAEHRATAWEILLHRAETEPVVVLCEKPMAAPAAPDTCRLLVDAAEKPGVVLLFDFPELFDPMTEQICRFLEASRDVTIDSVFVQRSKDREDPSNPRNFKRMVPIQYQEAVHCLAFVLYVIGRIRGRFDAALADGIEAESRAEPYMAPNPELYPTVVDGRCHYSLKLGRLAVTGCADFKRGAPWTKRRVLRGRRDGQPFLIDVEFLEGHKRLRINGISQAVDSKRDSYQDVVRTTGQWHERFSQQLLRDGVFPHARFARLTYQLSSLLWRCSQDCSPVQLRSIDDLLDFDARFAEHQAGSS
jgi:predicted dehydrogenase